MMVFIIMELSQIAGLFQVNVVVLPRLLFEHCIALKTIG